MVQSILANQSKCHSMKGVRPDPFIDSQSKEAIPEFVGGLPTEGAHQGSMWRNGAVVNSSHNSQREDTGLSRASSSQDA